MTTTAPTTARKQKPRCKYCGERFTASNTPLRYPLYGAAGCEIGWVDGCRWCAGLDDYTD